MKEEKLNRLKEVLSIPTKSRKEDLMIEYLKKVLTEKGYVENGTEGNFFTVDKLGNIYVTKGVSENYPCFISHTDTVHNIDHGLTVIETKDRESGVTILTGANKDTMRPSGIGGDDKCGVYLCLEMLDTFDNVKAVFFVSEEIGCIGSKEADPEFFSNVGYAIQYDSPEGNSMSYTLMGQELFEAKGEFAEKACGLILEHGVSKWEYHPYTDIWQLLEKFDFSCLNLAAGYYNMHRDNEYVIVEDVQNAYELGVKIVNELGENKYTRPKVEKEEPWWKRTNGYGHGQHTTYNTHQTETKQTLLNEGEDFDEEEYWDEWDDFFGEGSDWEDVFDYDDFNGGYTIENYGTYPPDHDW